MAPEQEKVDFKDYIKKLSRVQRVDSLETGGRMIYVIAPTPKELVALVEQGYFSKQRLQRIVSQKRR